MILTGKKTVLLPITSKDLEYNADLMASMETTSPACFLGNPLVAPQIGYGWLAKTKEGKASRNIGFMAYMPINEITVTPLCLIDYKFACDLDKQAHKKYTYVEDAVNTMIGQLFTRFNRIEITAFPENELGIFIFRKLGFDHEGVLRGAFLQGNKIRDLVIMAKVRSMEVGYANATESGTELSDSKTAGKPGGGAELSAKADK